jgi:hypothetical protein
MQIRTKKMGLTKDTSTLLGFLILFTILTQSGNAHSGWFDRKHQITDSGLYNKRTFEDIDWTQKEDIFNRFQEIAKTDEDPNNPDLRGKDFYVVRSGDGTLSDGTRLKISGSDHRAEIRKMTSSDRYSLALTLSLSTDEQRNNFTCSDYKHAFIKEYGTPTAVSDVLTTISNNLDIQWEFSNARVTLHCLLLTISKDSNIPVAVTIFSSSQDQPKVLGSTRLLCTRMNKITNTDKPAGVDATKESDITLIIDNMRKNIHSPGFRIGTEIVQFDQNKITKSETFETELANNTVSFSLDRISGTYTWNIKSEGKKINFWANNENWGHCDIISNKPKF